MNQPYDPNQSPAQYQGQPQLYPTVPQGGQVPYQPAFHQGPYPYPAGTYPMDIVSPNTNPMPWAGPYHDPSAMGDDDENFLTKKLGPLPVWGWALVAAGAAGVVGLAAWKLGFLGKQEGKDLAKNDASDSDDADSDDSEDSGEWSPSRSRFVEDMKAKFFNLPHNKSRFSGVSIYVDAEDAMKKGGIKTPSPLINMRGPKSAKLDQEPVLVALCKAEGLVIKENEMGPGVYGLHPDSSAPLVRANPARGHQWEDYIDALRSDGLPV